MRSPPWLARLLILLSITVPLGAASDAFALNILVTNDDGLTSNLRALYAALKAEGHDVIVSVPCTGQSGRGAAMVLYSTVTIVPDDDKTQIEAEGGCHNGAAPTGAPAVGPFLKAGYTNGDYHYVHGTPIMATMYGLDVVGQARWGKAPDLVLSGPNEGQNLGRVVISSGTVGNAQLAASRGLSAIAVSAGIETTDNIGLANPFSVAVAQLTVKLLKELQRRAGSERLLPPGIALNVNMPPLPGPNARFAFARFGSYNLLPFKFKGTPPYGLELANLPGFPTPEQAEDETLVSLTQVSVTAMQFGFEHSQAGQAWLRDRLGTLFAR